MNPWLVAALGAAVAIPAVGVYGAYRRYVNTARARVAGVKRTVVSTPWGEVEYVERGEGEPVLIVPGIFQHCVAGLLSARDFLAGRRVIAPSRFGYLGSTMPANATPAAQADASRRCGRSPRQ